MGRIAAVKMKMLPRFLFIFQNMIAVIPKSLLQQVQNLINEFICKGKTTKARISVPQQEIKKEGWRSQI